MTKKKQKQAVLSKEEVIKFKPENQTDKIAQVMGFGLTSAYDLALEEGASVAKRTNPEIKAGNVDKLPETK